MKKSTIITIFISISFLFIISLTICFGLLTPNKKSFYIEDTLSDGKGQDAKIIILAGQSNAAGCSRDEYLKMNVSESKYQEYENGYDNIYINYFISNSNISSKFVKCRNNQGEAGGFFGPELGLAEELNKQYPDQLFFIIKYTWSGTNLYDQWLSSSSFGNTGKLYEQFIEFTKTSIKYLVSKNYNVSIEGMCWMQGESDASSYLPSYNYEMHLLNFITDIRKEFSQYASRDGIAFIDAYIAESTGYWPYSEMVNKAKKNVAKMSYYNYVIDTEKEGLTCTNEPFENPDRAHYDSLSEIKLGYLFAINLIKYFN